MSRFRRDQGLPRPPRRRSARPGAASGTNLAREAAGQGGQFKDTELNAQLLRAAAEPAEVRGFTRGLIALLIVALIGLGLAAATFPTAADAGDVRKNIVTALTTVLATLAGFYFGSRTSQNTAEDAQRRRRPERGSENSRTTPNA